VPELIADAGAMLYQDLSFKMNFPTKRAGTFSVWGIGISDYYPVQVPKDTTKWEDLAEGELEYKQTKAVGGLGHKIFIGEKSYLKSTLAANYTQNRVTQDYVYTDWSSAPAADMRNTNWNIVFDTYLNTKFSAAHTNRTGINITNLFYDLDYWMTPDPTNIYPDDLINYAKGNGSSMAFSAFSQSSFRLNSRLTANVGLHGMYFRLIEKATVEPRVSVRWQAVPKHAFSLAYGKHSRREYTDVYFMEIPTATGVTSNRQLDFAKAHHLVMSYDWSISEHLHLKVEPYFQYLYDIPVEEGSVFSMINHRDFWMMIPLFNGGKGKNYGIDFTLERYMNNGYYYLFTASMFESLYTGGDDVWRNTRLNRNSIMNALGGKEWKMGKQNQNILSVSLRFALQGGERYIPIDEAASIAAKDIVYDNSRAYKTQLPTEFISHFNIAYKINRNKVAHEIALKMFNVNGNEEFGGYYYNYRNDRPEMYMGAVSIPNISYRIEF
jgi:hypothetical protein